MSPAFGSVAASVPTSVPAAVFSATLSPEGASDAKLGATLAAATLRSSKLCTSLPAASRSVLSAPEAGTV